MHHDQVSNLKLSATCWIIDRNQMCAGDLWVREDQYIRIGKSQSNGAGIIVRRGQKIRSNPAEAVKIRSQFSMMWSTMPNDGTSRTMSSETPRRSSVSR